MIPARFMKPAFIACVTLSALPSASLAKTAQDMLPEIETALAAQGAPAGALVALVAPDIPLADDAVLQSVSYSAASGRFVARAGAGGTPIAGTARVGVETPVLIQPVARGEDISADNIAYAKTTAALPADVALSEGALIGTKARRNLVAGAPLRRSDVAFPLDIRKNALVTVRYEAPGLTLSQTGVARSNGARGEAIEIAGADERVIRAVVTGPNEAKIVSPRLAAMER